MNLLVTEFSGSDSELQWERAYVEALRLARTMRSVHVVDVRDLPSGVASNVSLAVRAVSSGQILDGTALGPLVEVHSRQVARPLMALLVASYGGQADQAAEIVRTLLAVAPVGATRLIEPVADAGHLHRDVLTLLLLIADRRFGTQSPDSLLGYADEVVREELPGSPAATDAGRVYRFRGAP